MITEGNENGMVMPVAPMNGAGYNDGFGGANGGWWWFLILFFLIGGNGNWGWGNRGGSIETQGEVQRGFDQASVMNGVNGIASGICNGFSEVQQSLCNGFAGVNANVNAGFAGVEANANARQIANMQQAFAAQTAVSQGMNTIASSLQNCCCENRANVADLKYTVATENCADRAAISDGIRDLSTVNTANTQAILNAINGGIQSIKDDICADRLEAVKAENQNLRTQLNMANLAASQGAQTAQILADNFAQTQALEQYLAPVPRPAYIVQNPNGCNCGSLNPCGC
jgi:hypothetical protein